MPHSLAFLIALVSLCTVGPAWAQDADLARRFDALIQLVSREAAERGVPARVIEQAFDGLTPDPEIETLTERQPEGLKPIKTYVLGNLSAAAVEKGQTEAVRRKATLDAIEKRYGVPGSMVLAIWGIETRYGAITGKKDVPRSLATLAALKYRGDFFRNELLAALDILAAGDIAREDFKGSWAGAMGQAQFIPTSFIKYAVDFDGDGRRDLWGSTPDALASIANYLREKGWRAGLSWGFEVSVPEGYDLMVSRGKSAEWTERGVQRVDGRPLAKGADWTLFYPAGAAAPSFLVTRNYEAVRAYNQSDHYALSVAHLADRIAGRDAFPADWPDGILPLPRQTRIDMQKRLKGMGFKVNNLEGRIDLDLRDTIRQAEKKLGLTPDGNPDLKLIEALKTRKLDEGG